MNCCFHKAVGKQQTNTTTAKSGIISFSADQLPPERRGSNNEVEPRERRRVCFPPCRQEMQAESVAGRARSLILPGAPRVCHNPPVSAGTTAPALTCGEGLDEHLCCPPHPPSGEKKTGSFKSKDDSRVKTTLFPSR